MTKVTTQQILEALSLSHSRGSFYTEVGVTLNYGIQDAQRLDAVYVDGDLEKPLIVGYEVKVYRFDFKRDTKFLRYKDYCNQLYLACPTGVIKREEVPDGVGLICYNPDKKTLTVRKAAPYRKIRLPTEMLLRMAGSRLGLVERQKARSSERQSLEGWLTDKEARMGLGTAVRGRMADEVRLLDAAVRSILHILYWAPKEIQLELIKKLLVGIGRRPGETVYLFERELASRRGVASTGYRRRFAAVIQVVEQADAAWEENKRRQVTDPQPSPQTPSKDS